MAGWYWTRWPSREGLEREAESRPRWVLAMFGRTVLLVVVCWATLGGGKYSGWAEAAAAGGLLVAAGLSAGYLYFTREQRLAPSLGLAAAMIGAAWLANGGGPTCWPTSSGAGWPWSPWSGCRPRPACSPRRPHWARTPRPAGRVG